MAGGLPGCTRAVAKRRRRGGGGGVRVGAADDPLLERLKLDVGVAHHLAGAPTLRVRAATRSSTSAALLRILGYTRRKDAAALQRWAAKARCART